MIERASVDDAGAIADLEAVALGDDAWSEALVRDGVSGEVPTVHYLVARDGAAVVGYAAASVVADLAELQRIAVDPVRRRAGIATALLEAVFETARTAGAATLLLEVREDNAAALALYAATGFREIDRRPRYYRDGAAALVLERPVTGPPTNV